MRGSWLLLAALLVTSGCKQTLPDKVALTPEGEHIEILDEKPAKDIYLPIGEVSASAVGTDKPAAISEATNGLRNETATRGGRAVHIDSTDAEVDWRDGKTVVKLTGTAFRAAE
jgi:hypothetical protein